MSVYSSTATPGRVDGEVIRVRQHIPSFCEGLEPEEDRVPDLEAMLKLPWVEKWTDDDFVRWARSDNYLMAVRENSHWVVAFASPELLKGLPRWKPKSKEGDRDFIAYKLSRLKEKLDVLRSETAALKGEHDG